MAAAPGAELADMLGAPPTCDAATAPALAKIAALPTNKLRRDAAVDRLRLFEDMGWFTFIWVESDRNGLRPKCLYTI